MFGISGLKAAFEDAVYDVLGFSTKARTQRLVHAARVHDFTINIYAQHPELLPPPKEYPAPIPGGRSYFERKRLYDEAEESQLLHFCVRHRIEQKRREASASHPAPRG